MKLIITYLLVILVINGKCLKISNILSHISLKASFQLNKSFKSVVNLPLVIKNNIYLTKLSIGTPKQYFNLLVDTASAWLQVFSSKCKSCIGIENLYKFEKSKTFKSKEKEVILSFSGGQSFIGTSSSDSIFIDSLIPLISNFRFNLVKESIAVSPGKTFDGILGLAFNYTYYNSSKGFDSESLIDRLYWNSLISSNIFALYSDPTNKKGYLTIGGYNETFVKANNITWINVLDSDESFTWNLPLYSVAGIITKEIVFAKIDTGTAALELPVNFQEEFYKRIEGKNCLTFKQITKCECDSINHLNSFTINLGGFDFNLKPNDYAKYKNGICKMRINFNGNLLFGYTFLKNYYVIFDKENKRIGFIGYRSIIKPFISN